MSAIGISLAFPTPRSFSASASLLNPLEQELARNSAPGIRVDGESGLLFYAVLDGGAASYDLDVSVYFNRITNIFIKNIDADVIEQTKWVYKNGALNILTVAMTGLLNQKCLVLVVGDLKRTVTI